MNADAPRATVRDEARSERIPAPAGSLRERIAAIMWDVDWRRDAEDAELGTECSWEQALEAAVIDEGFDMAVFRCRHAADRILALTTPSLAAEPVAWRPIESAPRDGTAFLAAIQITNIVDQRSRWEQHVIWADGETGEIHPDAYCGWDWDDFSHWQPLPAPPEAK